MRGEARDARTDTRLDGSVVSVPCCNVFRLDGGLIAQYRVYIDIGPVFPVAG